MYTVHFLSLRGFLFDYCCCLLHAKVYSIYPRNSRVKRKVFSYFWVTISARLAMPYWQRSPCPPWGDEKDIDTFIVIKLKSWDKCFLSVVERRVKYCREAKFFLFSRYFLLKKHGECWQMLHETTASFSTFIAFSTRTLMIPT